MKKLTLALLLALCGARVYGQLPQEAVVKPEDLQAMAAAVETALNDTKSVDAICQELNLPKEEFKGWFARHKVLTGAGSALVTYAAILALSYCGQEAEFKGGKVTKLNGTETEKDKEPSVTKMIKFRNALTKLAWAQKPFQLAQTGWSKASKKQIVLGTLGAALAIFFAYELYQGKDSAVASLLNKLFGKKEAAPAASEVVAEEAAKAEVAQTTEVIAQAA